MQVVGGGGLRCGFLRVRCIVAVVAWLRGLALVD
jgi:hypothetical protein